MAPANPLPPSSRTCGTYISYQYAQTQQNTYTIASGTTVHFNLPCVGREAVGRIFCRDTALEGKAAGGDVILGQAKLLERGTRCNLNLCGNEINTGDLLRNSVLDLTVAECQRCIGLAWLKRLTFEG
jgi:hypothetical protein